MGRLRSTVQRLVGRAPAALRQRPRGFAGLGSTTRSGRPTGDRPVVEYAAEADGQPDPGEIVWGWVPYEDDPTRGKDRPVLLVAHHDSEWLGLMLSSQDHTRDPEREARHGRHWMDVGAGDWDSQRRPSEVRLDRLVRLDDTAIRREGAALPRGLFERVVARAREFHELG